MLLRLARAGSGCILIGALILGCSDEEVNAPERVVRQVGKAPNVLVSRRLTPECPNQSDRASQNIVTPACIEIWGNSDTILVDLPSQMQVPAEFEMRAWGHDGTGNNIQYKVTDFSLATATGISPLYTSFIDFPIQSPPFGSKFQISPKHPSNATYPVVVQFGFAGAPNVLVNLTVKVVPRVVPLALTSISLGPTTNWFKPPATFGIQPTYNDNYNGQNLLGVVPTTWQSSAPSVATVAAGIVTGLTRGTTTITATAQLTPQSPQVSATKSVTVEGCTALSVSPAGPISVDVTKTTTLTAVLTCDSHVVPASEPVTWTATPSSGVLTVVGQGAPGYQTGLITGTAIGTATVVACATNPPNPKPCSAPVTVSVVPKANITTLTTSPTPAKQYTPFTLTINGSGFNPSTAQMWYSQQLCYPGPTWCPPSQWPGAYTSRTSTQIVISSMVFSIPGPIQIQVRNGPSGTLSNAQTFTLNPLYP